MHSLSWLILLADFVNGFSVALCLGGGLCVIFGIIALVRGAVNEECQKAEEAYGFYNKLYKYIACLFTCFALAALVPNSRTILQVGGIEATVAVLESKAAADLGTEALATAKELLKQLRPVEKTK